MTGPDPHRAELAPELFFENARRAFYAARANTRHSTEYNYTIAHQTVRVSTAGDVIGARMLRAFAHLPSSASTPPALQVLMWDDTATNSVMPPPPWDWSEARMRRGEIRGYNNADIFTAFDSGADVLHVYDRRTQTALYWTRDACRLPIYEMSAPLRTILHWFMQSKGMHLVHGGAVGTAQGGVLLGGKGGSGKSTSVLACLDSDLLYAGDDYVVVAASPEPFVHSLYSSAKLTPESMARLPQLSRAVGSPEPPPGEKFLLFLNKEWQAKTSLGFPLVAIVLPRVRGSKDTTLTAAAPADGMRALGLSTLIQLPRADAPTTQAVQQLVNSLPVYFLDLGSDLDQIPSRISELIARGTVNSRASDA